MYLSKEIFLCTTPFAEESLRLCFFFFRRNFCIALSQFRVHAASIDEALLFAASVVSPN